MAIKKTQQAAQAMVTVRVLVDFTGADGKSYLCNTLAEFSSADADHLHASGCVDKSPDAVAAIAQS